MQIGVYLGGSFCLIGSYSPHCQLGRILNFSEAWLVDARVIT